MLREAHGNALKGGAWTAEVIEARRAIAEILKVCGGILREIERRHPALRVRT